jgi:hypothetical protein
VCLKRKVWNIHSLGVEERIHFHKNEETTIFTKNSKDLGAKKNP